MCSPLGEEAGDVLAEPAALPHDTARKSTAASEPIDGKGFMQAMLSGLCDGTVTVLSAGVERFFEPMMRVRLVVEPRDLRHLALLENREPGWCGEQGPGRRAER
jgi:hypothetical protein